MKGKMPEKGYTVEFYPDNKKVKATSRDSILDLASKAGIHLTAPCGGKGTCGKCKIMIEEGKIGTGNMTSLTGKDRKEGYYLACTTYPESGLKVIIPGSSRPGKHQILDHSHAVEKGVLTGDAGIAIDVGTTTVIAHLVDLKTKRIVAVASEHNRQAAYGADVISRMDYAKSHGTPVLNKAIIETVNSLINKILAGWKDTEVKEISAAGNTVMTYLLLNKNPEIIRKGAKPDEFGKTHCIDGKDLKIRSGGKICTLPCISGYVGGDVVGDVMASGMLKTKKVSMLIDIGTNGEIVIGNRDFLLACSTSAGPAFEGGEVSCGMQASGGAIENIRINEDLDVGYSTIYNEKPVGVCGSGLIDLVSDLFQRGVIDHCGRFTDVRTERIKRKQGVKEFMVVPKDETGSGREISINERDIRKLMLSKAAIYAGASTLAGVGGGFDEIDRIYVAGGFGYYLDIEKSITLGMLPDVERKKFTFIGNGSVKGACLFLTDERKRKEALDIAKKATYIDLGRDRKFAEEYIEALFLPHQDITRFPSVRA